MTNDEARNYEQATGRKAPQGAGPAYDPNELIGDFEEPAGGAERTIYQKRRDADAYAGIGKKFQKTQIRVDKAAVQAVGSVVSVTAPAVTAAESESETVRPITATRSNVMELIYKGLSKNGQMAFYSGAATVIRISLSAFPNKTAPTTLQVEGLAPAKAPRVTMTAEERKAARAARPKPTKAERAAKLREQAEKLAAEAAAEANDEAAQPAESTPAL